MDSKLIQTVPSRLESSIVVVDMIISLLDVALRKNTKIEDGG